YVEDLGCRSRKDCLAADDFEVDGVVTGCATTFPSGLNQAAEDRLGELVLFVATLRMPLDAKNIVIRSSGFHGFDDAIVGKRNYFQAIANDFDRLVMAGVHPSEHLASG